MTSAGLPERFITDLIPSAHTPGAAKPFRGRGFLDRVWTGGAASRSEEMGLRCGLRGSAKGYEDPSGGAFDADGYSRDGRKCLAALDGSTRQIAPAIFPARENAGRYGSHGSSVAGLEKWSVFSGESKTSRVVESMATKAQLR